MSRLKKEGIIHFKSGNRCILRCWQQSNISRLEWSYTSEERKGGVYMAHITQVNRQGDRGITIHYGTSHITLIMEDAGEAVSWYDLIIGVWQEGGTNSCPADEPNLNWARDNHLFKETNSDVAYESLLENTHGCIYDAKITELVFGKEGFAMKNKETAELVTCISYSNIRRHGLKSNHFYQVEVGRQTATGSGLISFRNSDAPRICQSVQNRLAEFRKAITPQVQVNTDQAKIKLQGMHKKSRKEAAEKAGNHRADQPGHVENPYSYATVPVLQWPKGGATQRTQFRKPIAPSEDRDGYLVPRQQRLPRDAAEAETESVTGVKENPGYLTMSSKTTADGYSVMSTENAP